MHILFGTADGKCGDCKHFVQGRYRDLNLKKCEIYGLTHSEASDWAKRWQACGCYNKDVPNRNVIRLVRSSAEKESIQVDGQQGFWEVL